MAFAGVDYVVFENENMTTSAAFALITEQISTVHVTAGNESICIMSPTTVSYTHLDVYKRQKPHPTKKRYCFRFAVRHEKSAFRIHPASPFLIFVKYNMHDLLNGGKSPVNFAAHKWILHCKDSGKPVHAINGEREVPSRQKVVRGSNIPVLISHAGLNPCLLYTSPRPERWNARFLFLVPCIGKFRIWNIGLQMCIRDRSLPD